MHLKGNFFGCMRSNCISHTSNVQRPIDCSRNKYRQLDETVPSVMSPCLPQWVVLSERETLFRSALDTALKIEMQNIYVILHEVQCQGRNPTIFISEAETNKTAAQLNINKTVQKKAISACQ